MLAVLIACTACTHTTGDRPPRIEFLGEVIFPTGYQFAGMELGGLSGIDYDPLADRYIAISDDRAQRGPVRFYELEIDLSDSRLQKGDVSITGVTQIMGRDNESLKVLSVDPESIRFAPLPGKIFWSDEGGALTSPVIRVMTLDGNFIEEFKTDDKYKPTPVSGTRNNKGFESLTIGYEPDTIIVAMENGLRQDGPAASLDSGSPARVLQIHAGSGQVQAEYIYRTDAVIDAPKPAGAFATNGLVELLTLDDTWILALERSFSTGAGNNVRLYLTTMQGASNVADLDSIAGQQIVAMPKKLLLNLDELGVKLDNTEGMTFGRRLDAKSRTLILVSDNNFNADGGQFTQFLAFRLNW